MRIQHNIMAMSAYRNYTNNVSAMKKNLEKLSSGYKINRAGDDAAGLAISEKMRAQITGLETAQKNAKDGISLVQTAEGALTEVHDMLNRMVELASMSANGTYDDTVDRVQLQKEMDQLTEEIDRIADSANFNGIKLLNGSMDADGVVHGTGSTSDLVNFAVPTSTATGVTKLPTVGDVLGTNTVLHAGAAPGGTGTEFSVDLHEVKFDAREGDSITITLGNAAGTLGTDKATITLTSLKTQAAPITGQALVEAITSGTTADYKVTVNGVDLANGDDVKITLKGTDVDINDTSKTTGRLDFVQSAVPTNSNGVIDGNMAVAISSARGTGITGSITTATPTNTTAAADGTKAVYEYDFAGLTDLGKGTYNVSIAGQNVQITLNADDNDATAVAAAVFNAIKDIEIADGLDDGAGNDTNYAITNGTAGKITFTTGGTPATATLADVVAISGNLSITRDETDRTTSGTNSVKGDYNLQTTDIKNVAAAGAERLASTFITLTDKMISNGGSMYIGDTYYTFTTDEAAKTDPTKGVYIGDVVGTDGKFVSNNDNLTKVARRLTDAAADNNVWTVGTGTTAGKITFVEKTNATGGGTGNGAANTANKMDLTTVEGIAKSLGYKGLDVAPTAGKALTLQIGDTADEWNQLKVKIKDMHADSLGIGKGQISIADQGDASDAIKAIKDAINKVSDVRGTLGATQNRLDHTINNLSVMTENIQDAESTIRDVDVAEEMMAYTKNNILIQSAQAMLAQANQVPQGVLQLLQ